MSSMTLKQFMTRGMEKRGADYIVTPKGIKYVEEGQGGSSPDSLFRRPLGTYIGSRIGDELSKKYSVHLADPKLYANENAAVIMDDVQKTVKYLKPIVFDDEKYAQEIEKIDAVMPGAGAKFKEIGDKIRSIPGLKRLYKTSPGMFDAFADQYIYQNIMKEMGLDPSKVRDYVKDLNSYDMNQHLPGMAAAFGIPFGIGALTGHPGWGALLGLLGAGGYGYYKYNQMAGTPFGTPPDLDKQYVMDYMNGKDPDAWNVDPEKTPSAKTEALPAPAEEPASAEGTPAEAPATEAVPAESGVAGTSGESSYDEIPGLEETLNTEIEPILEEPAPRENAIPPQYLDLADRFDREDLGFDPTQALSVRTHGDGSTEILPNIPANVIRNNYPYWDSIRGTEASGPGQVRANRLEPNRTPEEFGEEIKQNEEYYRSGDNRPPTWYITDPYSPNYAKRMLEFLNYPPTPLPSGDVFYAPRLKEYLPMLKWLAEKPHLQPVPAPVPEADPASIDGPSTKGILTPDVVAQPEASTVNPVETPVPAATTTLEGTSAPAASIETPAPSGPIGRGISPTPVASTSNPASESAAPPESKPKLQPLNRRYYFENLTDLPEGLQGTTVDENGVVRLPNGVKVGKRAAGGNGLYIFSGRLPEGIDLDPNLPGEYNYDQKAFRDAYPDAKWAESDDFGGSYEILDENGDWLAYTPNRDPDAVVRVGRAGINKWNLGTDLPARHAKPGVSSTKPQSVSKEEFTGGTATAPGQPTQPPVSITQSTFATPPAAPRWKMPVENFGLPSEERAKLDAVIDAVNAPEKAAIEQQRNQQLYGQADAPEQFTTPRPVNAPPEIGPVKSKMLPLPPKPSTPDPVGY